MSSILLNETVPSIEIKSIDTSKVGYEIIDNGLTLIKLEIYVDDSRLVNISESIAGIKEVEFGSHTSNGIHDLKFKLFYNDENTFIEKSIKISTSVVPLQGDINLSDMIDTNNNILNILDSEVTKLKRSLTSSETYFNNYGIIKLFHYIDTMNTDFTIRLNTKGIAPKPEDRLKEKIDLIAQIKAGDYKSGSATRATNNEFSGRFYHTNSSSAVEGSYAFRLPILFSPTYAVAYSGDYYTIYCNSIGVYAEIKKRVTSPTCQILNAPVWGSSESGVSNGFMMPLNNNSGATSVSFSAVKI